MVIPKAWWGSEHNRRVILKGSVFTSSLLHTERRIAVKQFIHSRRLETLTLHGVLQGFRSSDCDWLLPSKDTARNQRATASDSLKQRQLLEQFIYWYFDGFVIPLIRVRPILFQHTVGMKVLGQFLCYGIGCISKPGSLL
jgi:telomerase reverse transcriptase